MPNSTPMSHRLFRVFGLLVGAIFAAPPTEGRACEPLSFEAQFVIPPEGVSMPLQTVLLARVVAPNPELEEEIGLRTMDGVDVPIETTVERSSSGEYALVHASPIGPLDPETFYVWTIGPAERQFTTGSELDRRPPSAGPLSVTWIGDGVDRACPGGFAYNEYEFTVEDLGEPAGLYTRFVGEDGITGAFHHAYDGPIVIRVGADLEQDLCYEVFVEDHAGLVVSAGVDCIEAAVGEDSTGGGGSTGEPGSSTSAADSSSESGSEPGSTSGDVGTTGGGGASSGAGEAPGVDSGCACRAEPIDRPLITGLLLVLFGLGWRPRSGASSTEFRAIVRS